MQIDMGASRQVRSIALRQYPYRDSNSAHRRCTSSAATALVMAMRSSTKVPQAKWNRGSEVATRPGSCFLLCILLGCWWFVGGFIVVFGCLRHAGGWLVFQGFWGCLVWSGLRWWLGWCKLFPCCRSARVAPLGWFGLAERWWFENSRACLYYFVESF